ncbi:MAG: hypothetical protein H7323_04920, partial [Frankiales bacterium]|nr:hypothetical protein [Frankiales bacterium]
GAESDLTGFTVFEAGAAVKDGIGTAACDASSCATVVSYPQDAPGEHTYVVRAYRSVSPGSSDTLASAPSQSASATLSSTPPSAQPSAAPSSNPGAGGAPSSGSGTPSTAGSPAPGSSRGPTTAGSPPPGASSGPAASGSSGGPAFAAGPGQTQPGQSSSPAEVSQRRAFASGFAAFGPKLGIPKLPPLPQSQAPVLAAPLPDGTFAPTLGFQDQVLQERVESSTPGRRVTSVVNTALDSERMARSTAGALVLLLIGGHLRRWVSSPTRD